MKRFTAAAMLILVGITVLFCGCKSQEAKSVESTISSSELSPKSSISPDKVYNYAKGLDAESYDGSSFLKKMRKTYGFDENGSYASLNRGELKNYFSEKGISDGNTVELGYKSSMVSGTIFFLGKFEAKDKCDYELFAVEFEHEEDAKKYFDEVSEIIRSNLSRIKSSADTSIDSGVKGGINYCIANKIFGLGRLNPPVAIYNGIYQEDQFILFITAVDSGNNFNTEDAVEKFCKEMGILSPTNIY